MSVPENDKKNEAFEGKDQGNTVQSIALFQAQYPVILRIARRYVPTPDFVHDVVQQAFIDFMRYSSVWTSEEEARRILNQIVKNGAMDLWRKQQKSLSPARQLVALWLMEHAGEDRSDEKPEQCKKENEALKDCLESLPEKSRMLIEQHYFENISMEEIARLSGQKPGTIRQIVYRIRLTLKKCIERKIHG